MVSSFSYLCSAIDEALITMSIGLLLMKEIQDRELPSDSVYIRYISEVPTSRMDVHEEDELDEAGKPLRIIICMSKEGSRRLLQARYLQSDIGFKRVVGFQEFELGELDRDTCTSM